MGATSPANNTTGPQASHHIEQAIREDRAARATCRVTADIFRFDRGEASEFSEDPFPIQVLEGRSGTFVVPDIEEFRFRNSLGSISPEEKARIDRAMSCFSKAEKTAVLIDGANFQKSSKYLGFGIDYLKVRHLFEHYLNVHSIYFFSAVDMRGNGRSHTREVVDWMQGAGGFRVRQKPAKHYKRRTQLPIVEDHPRSEKITVGNMDVEIAVVALSECNNADHIVIVSGDGDFRYLVEQLQRNEKKVTVISTRRTEPHMASHELVRQTDHFVELDDLRPAIVRDTQEARMTVPRSLNS